MSDEPKPFRGPCADDPLGPFRGPCADDPLGEELLDLLPILAIAGFAPEISSCRFLCNETFEIREPGAIADVLKNALEAVGASAKRALLYPLSRAVQERNKEEVHLLLALGAPMNEVAPFRDTVLTKAVLSRQPDVVELLLARGADINLQSTYGTALIVAATQADEAMVRLLLKHGADTTLQTSDGHTALSRALIPHMVFRAPGIPDLLRAHGAV